MHVINSLQLLADPTTANKVLKKGLDTSSSHYSIGEFNNTTLKFSFQPFVRNSQKLHKIWTKLIEAKEICDKNHRQQLTIEFESDDIPALPAIRAMVRWLEAKQLSFEVRYQYRWEDRNWEGEYCARSRH